jgi:uncharacterized protein
MPTSWIHRTISEALETIVNTRPVTVVTGARQVGKSSLIRTLLPDSVYVSLDRPAVAQQAESNAAEFLGAYQGKQLIIDEVQYAPSIFRELKLLVDEDRGVYGRYILTGSQLFHLMAGVTESLAGRVGIATMGTLSCDELRGAQLLSSDVLWRGGYPELWAHQNLDPGQFYSDYIATYLERDVRNLVRVSDLRQFDNFLRLFALRAGQTLNLTEIARDAGVSATTVKSWSGVLETSGIVTLVAPYFRNLSKRLIKSPKIYWNDNGLLCSLAGICNTADYQRSIIRGALWENFVWTELSKALSSTLGIGQFYYYRDKYGVEVDFVCQRGQRVILIEAKVADNPDYRSTHLKAIKELFEAEGMTVTAVLACGADRLYQMDDYMLWNPLQYSAIDLIEGCFSK